MCALVKKNKRLFLLSLPSGPVSPFLSVQRDTQHKFCSTAGDNLSISKDESWTPTAVQRTAVTSFKILRKLLFVSHTNR